MKKNKGRLSMSEKYTFIDITDVGENFSVCENCGAIIRYVVHLRTSTNKNVYVGTECSKTLQEAQITNEYSMNENIKAFKKVATAKNLIEKGTKVRVAHYTNDCIIVGLNSNGKATKIYLEKTFNPFDGGDIKCLSEFIDSIKHLKDKNFTCLGSPIWYYEFLKTGKTQFKDMF